jgi:hypothetical protein
MGYGSYSHDAHVAISKARAEAPREQVFKQTSCHALMNPLGLTVRESRDSAAHPNSVGIIFALDVTGSMGKIPEQLAREKLPSFMKAIMDAGVPDPQILFLAVGDATCDKAPLQVGQFESSEREMDQWLTWSFLEGGGGGQNTESYELAFYLAARHTAMDCWEKRQRRGYLFLTGDEHPYPVVSRRQVQGLVGADLGEDISLKHMVEEAQRTFEPFFLIPDQGRRARCERLWRDLLGDHVLCLEDPAGTGAVAAGVVALREGSVKDLEAFAEHLKFQGDSAQRVGAVVRALTPFAATLGKDGAPGPKLAPPEPPKAGLSGHRR